jgi:hypothetical protein
MQSRNPVGNESQNRSSNWLSRGRHSKERHIAVPFIYFTNTLRIRVCRFKVAHVAPWFQQSECLHKVGSHVSVTIVNACEAPDNKYCELNSLHLDLLP